MKAKLTVDKALFEKLLNEEINDLRQMGAESGTTLLANHGEFQIRLHVTRDRSEHITMNEVCYPLCVSVNDQGLWVPIEDEKLEFGANYWLKTKDGLVINEVATYDGIHFTNGRWPIAKQLIAEVIKLTPPKAGA